MGARPASKDALERQIRRDWAIVAGAALLVVGFIVTSLVGLVIWEGGVGVPEPEPGLTHADIHRKLVDAGWHIHYEHGFGDSIPVFATYFVKAPGRNGEITVYVHKTERRARQRPRSDKACVVGVRGRTEVIASIASAERFDASASRAAVHAVLGPTLDRVEQLP